MRRFALIVLGGALMSGPVHAQTGNEAGSDIMIQSRMDPSRADVVITTLTGDASLLLAGDAVWLQLTDAAFSQLRQERSTREPRSFVAERFEAAVRGGIAALFDLALGYPVARIRKADYVDGRLLLTGSKGARLFDVTVGKRHLMADFSESDARGFVAELERRMAAG